jgi:hypothetical protein
MYWRRPTAIYPKPNPIPTNLLLVYLADYVTPNGKMTSKLRIGKNVEGIGRGMI